MLLLDNISFSYPHQKCLIEHMDLKIKKGESVGLVGCNGAGKSTLLALICGLQLPKSGVISFDGITLKKDTLAEIRKNIGLVFQNPDDQLFMPSVYEDVVFGPRNYGCTEEKADQYACEAMERMGILHLKNCAPYNLSGGEKRSAAIATVLSMQPKMLLFDEPTAFLDPGAVRNFEETLRSLDLSYVIASHDLDFILNVCSRVLVMKNGAFVADGKAEEILQDENLLTDVGLELPISFRRCKKCSYDFSLI